MIKIGKLFRNSIIGNLKEAVDNYDMLFVIQYSGLSSVQMTMLRNSLKSNQSKVLITKNTLISRALKDSKFEGLIPFVKGPTGLIFGSQDITVTAKALSRFVKDNQNLNISAAIFEGGLLSKDDIQKISNLPAKEELYAQVVYALKAPFSNLVFTLKGNLNKLAIVLNQIKEKKA